MPNIINIGDYERDVKLALNQSNVDTLYYKQLLSFTYQNASINSYSKLYPIEITLSRPGSIMPTKLTILFDKIGNDSFTTITDSSITQAQLNQANGIRTAYLTGDYIALILFLTIDQNSSTLIWRLCTRCSKDGLIDCAIMDYSNLNSTITINQNEDWSFTFASSSDATNFIGYGTYKNTGKNIKRIFAPEPYDTQFIPMTSSPFANASTNVTQSVGFTSATAYSVKCRGTNAFQTYLAGKPIAHLPSGALLCKAIFDVFWLTSAGAQKNATNDTTYQLPVSIFRPTLSGVTDSIYRIDFNRISDSLVTTGAQNCNVYYHYSSDTIRITPTATTSHVLITVYYVSYDETYSKSRIYDNFHLWESQSNYNESEWIKDDNSTLRFFPMKLD